MTRRSLATFCLALGFATLAARPAHAWGNDGHRITGEIAWHHLSPQAENAVLELLVDEDYATLADTSTWADTYARSHPRYAFANKLHYVNVPADAEAYSGEHCTQKCVVSAIKYYARVLRSPGSRKTEKVEALRFLAHFVGDLHQPLHVAHPDDRGGNLTPVRFFGRERKAHWVWDTGLILEMKDAAIPSRGDAFEVDADWYQQKWRWLAFRIRTEISPAHAKSWSAIDPDAWATESLQVAQTHAFLKRNERVEQDYLDAKSSIVSEQLAKGGVRLAALLNAIFSDAPLPEPLR